MGDLQDSNYNTASLFELAFTIMASRYLFSRGASLMRSTLIGNASKPARQGKNFATTSRVMSEEKTETDAEFDARYEAYFNRKDIDGWEIRKGMADLGAMDLVPEPTIVAAALRACRRVNDYALTTRILELVKFKAQHNPEIWPYMMQELKPTMDELGVASLEELGYDQPEFFIDPQYRN